MTNNVKKPEFPDETIVSKEMTDASHKIEAEATESLKKSYDEAERAAIQAKAEAKKKEPKKESIVAKPEVKTIRGLKIDISGMYVASGKPQYYTFKGITIPYTEGIVGYMKQIAYFALKESGVFISLEDIIRYDRDDETEVELTPTFFNKSIMEMNLEELLHAKIYYQLRGVVLTDGIRTARTSLYKAVCRLQGIPEPDGDQNIKKWTVIKLKG